MTEYATVIAYIAFFIAGVTGFFTWIGVLADFLNYGNALFFVLTFVFGELLIPWYGIVPFIQWFFILFIVGLPFYGIYKLFSK